MNWGIDGCYVGVRDKSNCNPTLVTPKIRDSFWVIMAHHCIRRLRRILTDTTSTYFVAHTFKSVYALIYKWSGLFFSSGYKCILILYICYFAVFLKIYSIYSRSSFFIDCSLLNFYYLQWADQDPDQDLVQLLLLPAKIQPKKSIVVRHAVSILPTGKHRGRIWKMIGSEWQIEAKLLLEILIKLASATWSAA